MSVTKQAALSKTVFHSAKALFVLITTERRRS